MSQYLPNLRRLDLSHSRKLEKIIDFGEFPNLEKLKLEGCIKLVELDPSIGLLSKLVYLNLNDCKNLASIPNNIFGLRSLEDLNMYGCSKVFKNLMHLKKPGISSKKKKNKKKHDIRESASHSSFPTPKTNTYLLPFSHSLYCLRNVDISFCRLNKVPDSIECLHWLEGLNLRRNNFVTLPCLRKLSKLEYLNLEHCRLLESLPQLPSPPTSGRDQRENNNTFIGLNDVFIGRNITGLVIFNCPKLADSERERCSSMTFSWMIQFIQANTQSYPTYFDKIQIVTPGSEIPSWINNQIMGDSIPIDFSPAMHDNTIGFVCSAVFSVAPVSTGWIKIMNIDLDIPVTVNRDLVTNKSSHIWIIYLPRGSYDKFENICCDVVGGEGLGMEVKSCGYRWVCKQDLQEFNITMMNHEKSLAPKCKIIGNS